MFDCIVYIFQSTHIRKDDYCKSRVILSDAGGQPLNVHKSKEQCPRWEVSHLGINVERLPNGSLKPKLLDQTPNEKPTTHEAN
jgi:hypothetical protein